MEIDYNEFSNEMFSKILRLETRVYVLENLLVAYMDILKPGKGKALAALIEAFHEDLYEKALLDHKWTKGHFDDLLRGLMTGD